MEKHDWPTIKEQYVTGPPMALKELAILVNVPYQSIRRKAAKERWNGCRLVYKNWGVYCDTPDEQRSVFRAKAIEEVMSLQ